DVGRIDTTSKIFKNLVLTDYNTRYRRDDIRADYIDTFEINAPYMLSLTIKGKMCFEKFLLLDVSSLVKADLNYRGSNLFANQLGRHREDIEEELLRGLLSSMGHVNEIALGSHNCLESGWVGVLVLSVDRWTALCEVVVALRVVFGLDRSSRGSLSDDLCVILTVIEIRWAVEVARCFEAISSLAMVSANLAKDSSMVGGVDVGGIGESNESTIVYIPIRDGVLAVIEIDGCRMFGTSCFEAISSLAMSGRSKRKSPMHELEKLIVGLGLRGTGKKKENRVVLQMSDEPGEGKISSKIEQPDKNIGSSGCQLYVEGSGGVSGQIGAIRLGMSRALQNWAPDQFRPPLKEGSYSVYPSFFCICLKL
ncbi:ribonuclease H-like domain-containing protein, partial [Tanacetum coccineum]